MTLPPPSTDTALKDPTFCKQVVVVDDEPSILSALGRVFYDDNLTLTCFESAQHALVFCRENTVAVVLSDVQMPGMNGIELMSQLAKEFPHLERILLTGQSDMGSTIEAINRGRVSYFLEKPWDEDRLRGAINKGIELANMRRRNHYLEACLNQKNQQLTQWSHTLEERVLERTEQLRESYLTAIQVISGMVEKRLGERTPSPRVIALISRNIGVRLGLDDIALRDLRFAALLCHVGKMAFNDELLNTPFFELSAAQREQYCQHPAIAETTIMFIPPLSQAATVLRQHREQADGKGYPNQLTLEDLSTSALILGVTLFYLECRKGLRFKTPLPHNDSITALTEQRGVLFPTAIVDAAIPALSEWADQQQETEGEQINSRHLEVGMILARDLYAPNGLLLLAQDKPVDQHIIDRLLEIEHNQAVELNIYVLANTP